MLLDCVLHLAVEILHVCLQLFTKLAKEVESTHKFLMVFCHYFEGKNFSSIILQRQHLHHLQHHHQHHQWDCSVSRHWTHSLRYLIAAQIMSLWASHALLMVNQPPTVSGQVTPQDACLSSMWFWWSVCSRSPGHDWNYSICQFWHSGMNILESHTSMHK